MIEYSYNKFFGGHAYGRKLPSSRKNIAVGATYGFDKDIGSDEKALIVIEKIKMQCMKESLNKTQRMFSVSMNISYLKFTDQ